MVSRQNKQRRSKRQQRGGDGSMSSVGYPIQWFNPGATVPTYYPTGSEILTRQYQTLHGPISAVSTTQANAAGTEMGPNLAPFSPYDDLSGIMTGGAQRSFQHIVNPINGRKVSIRSKLGKQIIKQYIKQVTSI
jgi:hypothetical protein